MPEPSRDTVRPYVGFVADFPSEQAAGKPAGEELASFLHDALAERGIHTTPLENRDDFAWEMRWDGADVEVTTLLGFVGDMDSDPPRQWLVTNDAHLPLLRRLLGGRALRAAGREAVRRMVEALHEILASDGRFEHVLWHRAETFDQPGDEPATAP